MDNKMQAKAVRKVTVGYLLIFLAINIGTIDLLPDWAGYLIMISALPVLAEREKSAMLLKPLGVALAVWSLIQWALKIFGGTVNVTVIILLFAILQMYFDFQLITDISILSANKKQKRKIRNLRNAVVILRTCLTAFEMFPKTIYIAVAVALVHLVLFIWIVAEFREIAAALEKAENQNELNIIGENESLNTDEDAGPNADASLNSDEEENVNADVSEISEIGNTSPEAEQITESEQGENTD